MSFELFHKALGQDELGHYQLDLNLAMMQTVRNFLAQSGLPQANQIYQNLHQYVNSRVNEAHGNYAMGRGPTASMAFRIAKLLNPDMTAQQVWDKFIKPGLPEFQTRDLPEGADPEKVDHSLNRHYATMIRVAFGSNRDGGWNHELLDKMFDEGKIPTHKQIAADDNLRNKVGALLYAVTYPDSPQRQYAVRICTAKFNKNNITVAERMPYIDGAVFVAIEEMYAVHDEGRLIDDTEVEGYVTQMLADLGLTEDMPVIEDAVVTQDADPAVPAEPPAHTELGDNLPTAESVNAERHPAESLPEVEAIADQLPDVTHAQDIMGEMGERGRLLAESGLLTAGTDDLSPAADAPTSDNVPEANVNDPATSSVDAGTAPAPAEVGDSTVENAADDGVINLNDAGRADLAAQTPKV